MKTLLPNLLRNLKKIPLFILNYLMNIFILIENIVLSLNANVMHKET
jgi:hypothetical protein